MVSRSFVLRQVFLVGLVGLAFGAALATPSSGSVAVCNATFAGPKYKQSGHSTTKYQVAAAGVSCSFAKTWAKRLVGKPTVKGTASGQVVGVVPGAPSGWQCNAYDPRGETVGGPIAKRAWAATCAPTTPGERKKFDWHPV